ncbi:MAG TPA: sigma factor-like helix-turn-helix DNA-binding protein [Methylomirabilota bacterium]
MRLDLQALPRSHGTGRQRAGHRGAPPRGPARGGAGSGCDETALILHDVEGTPKSDVAQILGVDVQAVKSRVHRARLFVRRRLSEHFGAGEAA